MVYQSYSSEETKLFGERLAKKLANSKGQIANRKSALIVALTGDLGSGKTTFIQGFLRGLGIKKRATSPTFIIFRKFAIRNSQFVNLYHIDAYRLKKAKDLSALGFKEILDDSQNMVLIEWAEKIKKILPKNTFWLKFSHDKRENGRKILFKGGVL